MCIICVKPIGINMPSKEIIKNCWDGNTDGAGISYWRNGSSVIDIDKGYMKLNKLNARLNELDLGSNDLAVLHFRFATHGVVDRGNCHPFPLSYKIEDLRNPRGIFKSSIAHNGVFGSLPCHEKLSDTMKFIRGIMANPLVMGHLDNKAVRQLIAGYCGSHSKLAILRPGKLLLIGDFIEDSGLLYSNNGYKQWATCSYDTDEEGGFKYKCELCYSTDRKIIDYRDELELFLCDKCFLFNTTVNNIAEG